MLEVSNLDTFYGRIQALWDISLTIGEAEVVALVGANGAGKTTLLNTLSGLLRSASGRIEFCGRRIDGLRPHAIVELGLSHIPEGRRLFPDMSVRENLEMGAYLQRVWKGKAETLEQVYQLFPKLRERQGQLARTLSGGEQQRAALARLLAVDPILLILDEPFSAQDVESQLNLVKLFKKLNSEFNITIICISHDLRILRNLANRVIIIKEGVLVESGTTKEVFDSPKNEYTKFLLSAEALDLSYEELKIKPAN
jgi:branched-chain amino acid transport system ATP-binding protein